MRRLSLLPFDYGLITLMGLLILKRVSFCANFKCIVVNGMMSMWLTLLSMVKVNI
jgi:hypothetical protein